MNLLKQQVGKRFLNIFFNNKNVVAFKKKD